MSINILKELKIILVKKFDKYDYNFKYRFILIKFHKKKKERKNIAKTTKTKYAITNFLWWNLKIKLNSWVREFECGKIFEWKKWESFQVKKSGGLCGSMEPHDHPDPV